MKRRINVVIDEDVFQQLKAKGKYNISNILNTTLKMIVSGEEYVTKLEIDNKLLRNIIKRIRSLVEE